MAQGGSAFTVPFSQLPAIWSRSRTTKTEDPRSVHILHADGGLALPPGFTVQFDDQGLPIFPDGTILVLEPDGENAQWKQIGASLFGGTVIEPLTGNRVFFVLLDEFGLVHLGGAAQVTTQDGSSKELK